MKTRWTIRSGTDFRELRTPWTSLQARCGACQLLDFDFFLALQEEIGGHDLHVAVLGDPGEPAGMALLERAGWGRWQTYQPSQGPIGALLLDRAVGLAPALTGLTRSLPGLALAVGVTQQDPLYVSRPEDGPTLATLDYIETARIEVRGTFEEYWTARGRNLRKNLRRQTNLLSRNGVAVRLETVDEAGRVEQAIADYGNLESAGWKSSHGTDIHPDNAQGRFYTRILRHYMERGEAVVFRFFYDDRLVATDLCLRRDGTLIILKTTYDERESSTSPAQLMRQVAFEQIFDGGGYSWIEFYGPAMDWHRKWAEDIRTMFHVTSFRSSLVPRLHRLLTRRSREQGPTQGMHGRASVAPAEPSD